MQTREQIRQMVGYYVLALIPLGFAWYVLKASPEVPTEIQLRGASSIAVSLLVLAVCTGIAAMATVQVWKLALKPRAAFHATQLEFQFADQLGPILGLARPPVPASESLSAEPRAQRSRFEGLLDNPTELVMGQVRSAAEYIMIRPNGYEKALSKLAGSTGEDAVRAYLAKVVGTASDSSPSKDFDAQAMGISEALVPVRFFIEQRLNLLHVTLKERWNRQVRMAALAVAGAFGFLAAVLADLGPGEQFAVVFAAAVWGGFFAWFVRDMAALVERRRR
jgi:hypothetical protein